VTRKRAVFFTAPVLLCTALITALAGAQFYKPNREARLAVTLKNKERYIARQPVWVTVMLSNQGREPVLVNSRMLFNQYPLKGEVSFTIEGPKRQTYLLRKMVIPQELRDSDLAVLRAGETRERAVDLSELYDVRKRGKYKVQVLYYNSVDLEKEGLKTWRGSIASEPAEIILQ